MSEFIVDVQDMERAEPEGPVPAVHGAPHRLGQRHRALLRRQEHHLRQQRHHRQGLYIFSRRCLPSNDMIFTINNQGLERPQGLLHVHAEDAQGLCQGPRLRKGQRAGK